MPGSRPRARPSTGSFGRSRVFLPTGRESAAFDQRAISETGVPSTVLMECAGRAAALVVQRLHPRGRIVVVAGGGNNGGDGVVMARSLTAWGRDVELVVAGERPDPDPLLHGWSLPRTSAPENADGLRDALGRADVVVDALLGTGIRGAPRDPAAAVIRSIAACGRPVVALDVPSGVDADTGAVGGEAVRADVTVAFGTPKLGCLMHPGRERAGRLVAVEIGFPPWSQDDASARLVTRGWAASRRPRRPPVTHKNAEGRLLLVAGSPELAGAAVLSARGALRAGVGFLRVAAPPELRGLLQAAVPEAVHVDAKDHDALTAAVRASDAVAVGPGLGTGSAAREGFRRLLEARADRALLLDADALNLLATDALDLPAADALDLPADDDSAERAPTGGGVLLTPHPGEAARLLACDPGDVLADPPGAARRISERHGAATLLKGTPSLVAPADPAEPLLVSGEGSSDLARAGMGDVLTGVAAAFLARGSTPSVAGGLALHFTGRAADLAGMGEALLPTDVARWMHEALAEDGDGASDLGLPLVLLDLPPAR